LPDGDTVDVEADETVVAKYCQTEQIDGAEKLVHYFYVWVGMLQRGCPDKLYLVPAGVTRSVDQGRLPPLRNDFWAGMCEAKLSEESKIVLMTDAASAYRDVGHPGIVDKASVCHENKEFIRSTEVLANTKTRRMRPAMAGTQALDSEWKYLKDRLPNVLSARTSEGRARIDLYIRSEQWRRQRRSEDPWPRFCKAVQDWRVEVRAGTS